jgi:hypothetical protein
VGPKSKTDQAVAFEGLPTRPWSDFSSKWDDVQGACRASPTGSCAFKPTKVAEGGDLKIVLHSAGQGVNVDFFRIGGPPPEAAAPAQPEAKPSKASKASKKKAGKKHKPELLDGVKATDVAAEVEEAPPATEALFQFRAQEAVTVPSAVSETLKPVCGATSCGVVVQAEKATVRRFRTARQRHVSCSNCRSVSHARLARASRTIATDACCSAAPVGLPRSEEMA